MRSWLILLGGLLLWSVHFFALYIVGEFSGGGTAVRVAIGVLTVVLLLADLALLLRIWTRKRAGFAAWRDQVGMLGAMLAAIAIFWQSLPAILTVHR